MRFFDGFRALPRPAHIALAVGFITACLLAGEVRALCNDSMLDPGEDCDPPGGCCASDCKFELVGVSCRAIGGVCDLAESCSGSDPNCPPDAKSTSECRASVGACDLAELCDGVSNTCPADSLEPPLTVCRVSADLCDTPESCTGIDPNCPPDGFKPATLECRASAGGCDVAENCTGSDPSCPVDAFEPIATLCRDFAGICDVKELCTGSSGLCPADAFEPATLKCRASADVCDSAELCTGSSADCPSDTKSTTECRGSAGDCDPAEFCDGLSDTCPSDAKSTATCRPAAGLCDIAEACDGASNSCPATDVLQPASTECRAVAGTCDVAEVCTGVASNCPTDAFEPASFECRNSGGVCDPAESCTGTGPLCPIDAKSTAECRASVGPCDLAESWDGVGGACPADAKSTGECRSAVGPCDIAELCDGVSDTCPVADILAPATTECRSLTSACDVAELCTGVDPNCPVDAFEPNGISCDDSDMCTIDDVCVGGVCQGDSGLDGLASCGNGVKRGSCGEECDDGNLEDCDGCSSRCEVEEEPCGAQSQDQRNCITDLNRKLGGVAHSQGKLISRCIRNAAKGRLGEPIDDCLMSDPKGLVARAETKTHLAEVKCNAVPGFGPRDADTINTAAEQEELNLTYSIFGGDLDGTIVKESVNQSASKCQLAVEAAVRRCRSVKLKEFVKCKKTGLKEESITDAASLRAVCVGSDAKGKVAAACNPVSGRIRLKIARKCFDPEIDLAQLFPACSINDAEATATCLERLVECHACLALAGADDFGPAICDVADDSFENSSCGDFEASDIGAKCGPGVHWIDGPCDAGLNVLIGTSAFIGIDLDSDCVSDLSITLSGDAVIERSAPIDRSINFPDPNDCDGSSCGLVDAHLDVIDTEIVSMSLTGGGVVLRVGDDASVSIPNSLGTVVENGDPALADSFFEVFLELEVGGVLFYNHSPVKLKAETQCQPPEATYMELTQCVPLFDQPFGGVQTAAVVFAEYNTNP